MKTTSYVYGIESGKIYGEYGNSLVAARDYRKYLGLEGESVPAPEWATGLNEELGLVSDVPFGKAGFKSSRAFRSTIRRRLSHITVATRKSRNCEHPIGISLWDAISSVTAWTWLVSGVAALIAAFTVVPAPLNVVFALYGAIPAVKAVKDLRKSPLL